MSDSNTAHTVLALLLNPPTKGTFKQDNKNKLHRALTMQLLEVTVLFTTAVGRNAMLFHWERHTIILIVLFKLYHSCKRNMTTTVTLQTQPPILYHSSAIQRDSGGGFPWLISS